MFPIMIVLAVAGCLVWFLAGAGGPDARIVKASDNGARHRLGRRASVRSPRPCCGSRRPGVVVIAAIATVVYDVGGFFIGRNTGQRPAVRGQPEQDDRGAARRDGRLCGGRRDRRRLDQARTVDGYGPALALGLAAAVAAPLGDLCQSLIKRDLGVKDMGTILPGHGGILDRFDAVLFVLPTIYYLVTIVGHRV